MSLEFNAKKRNPILNEIKEIEHASLPGFGGLFGYDYIPNRYGGSTNYKRKFLIVIGITIDTTKSLSVASNPDHYTLSSTQ